jgi:hypothetical protein
MDVSAVSLYPPSRTLRRPDNKAVEPGYVQRIVIGKLPEPDEATSLERVLEFREDPRSKGTLLSLHRWISTLSKASASPVEVVQELDWLLHEYEQHMRLHEMKMTKGVFETVITLAAETAEDLVKVRWGKLAKGLFALSARRIDLLEAELKAPGREIAYVFRARQTFGR